MIDTTTMPRLARAEPSYMVSLLAPPVSEPPWIHTMTGIFFASAGAQTFSDRQSSLIAGRGSA